MIWNFFRKPLPFQRGFAQFMDWVDVILYCLAAGFGIAGTYYFSITVPLLTRHIPIQNSMLEVALGPWLSSVFLVKAGYITGLFFFSAVCFDLTVTRQVKNLKLQFVRGTLTKIYPITNKQIEFHAETYRTELSENLFSAIFLTGCAIFPFFLEIKQFPIITLFTDCFAIAFAIVHLFWMRRTLTLKKSSTKQQDSFYGMLENYYEYLHIIDARKWINKKFKCTFRQNRNVFWPHAILLAVFTVFFFLSSAQSFFTMIETYLKDFSSGICFDDPFEQCFDHTDTVGYLLHRILTYYFMEKAIHPISGLMTAREHLDDLAVPEIRDFVEPLKDLEINGWIKFEDVTTVGLENINFELNEGGQIVMDNKNPSTKKALINILLGKTLPEKGHIILGLKCTSTEEGMQNRALLKINTSGYLLEDSRITATEDEYKRTLLNGIAHCCLKLPIFEGTYRQNIELSLKYIDHYSFETMHTEVQKVLEDKIDFDKLDDGMKMKILYERVRLHKPKAKILIWEGPDIEDADIPEGLTVIHNWRTGHLKGRETMSVNVSAANKSKSARNSKTSKTFKKVDPLSESLDHPKFFSLNNHGSFDFGDDVDSNVDNVSLQDDEFSDVESESGNELDESTEMDSNQSDEKTEISGSESDKGTIKKKCSNMYKTLLSAKLDIDGNPNPNNQAVVRRNIYDIYKKDFIRRIPAMEFKRRTKIQNQRKKWKREEESLLTEDQKRALAAEIEQETSKKGNFFQAEDDEIKVPKKERLMLLAAASQALKLNERKYIYFLISATIFGFLKRLLFRFFTAHRFL
eukprot:GHVP01060124.1.p1 GENE.GHVP01060124.1~~GHVP01060124.1.p1  ORF type:complete len:802 (+),score=138.19 GHVP01060124.1:15-2420(+)